MSAGIVVVWEDGKPARRISRGDRDLVSNAVVREGETVSIYVDDVVPYERGARHRDFETVLSIVRYVRDTAPALKIDASIIAFALETGSGNAARALAVIEERVGEVLARGGKVLDVEAQTSTIPFAKVFELDMGAPPPFEIPIDYHVLDSSLYKGKHAETMIGTRAGTAIVLQADIGEIMKQPVGWFFAGFWGYGTNSYSVYYGRATERSLVFLRLPYGAGAYERDPKGSQKYALDKMKRYIALAETLPCKHVTLIQSQGYAHWRIERHDGTIAEMEHDRNDFFTDLGSYDLERIAREPATPCGLEIVWSQSAPLHKLVRAPYVLGREQDAPDDERMSRRHLVIKAGSPNPYLEDPGSRNGTYIDGERVTRGTYPAGTIVRAARTVGILVTDVDEIGRAPHPAVARAKTIHEAAAKSDFGIPIHASYVAWALAQTWPSRDALISTTRWALDEMDVLGEKLLRLREWHPRLRGDRVTPFATLFERMMNAAPPFPIPDYYWVYEKYDHPEGPTEALIGTRALKPMVLERDDGGIGARPVGWFLAGFHGQISNDTSAVYYGRVTARSRVYLRLRMRSMDRHDLKEAPAKALATMKKYIALAETLPCKHVLLQQAYDACHWRIQRLDGTVVEMKQTSETFPSYLDDYDLEAIARGQ